ncbi:hypothetical protein FO519_005874 [Halicephalobus sp. NKZ332]|nr:hypothetical protein FO519_005874 [Halicephalobus sp. NKZ332]
MGIVGVILVCAIARGIGSNLNGSLFKKEFISVGGRLECCRLGPETKIDCRGVFFAGVTLYDKNYLYPDSALNETISDESGFFKITGSRSQLGLLNPYLEIIHKCNVPENEFRSHRNFRISYYKIPREKVTRNLSSEIFGIYPLNLNSEGFLEIHEETSLQGDGEEDHVSERMWTKLDTLRKAFDYFNNARQV